MVFSNNTQINKSTDGCDEENATKSLDMFSSQIVMNIMDQISEINTNLSSSNTQDLETNLAAKYVSIDSHILII